MENTITTRKAAAKELEYKLKITLQELKSSQDLCKQLLQEREDGEVEIQEIVKKNSELKQKLAELHTNYVESVTQHDRLCEIVNTFNQCSDEHERAFNRITKLEDAKTTINQLKQIQRSHESQKTQSLYSELVECNSQLIIDLTKDDS